MKSLSVQEIHDYDIRHNVLKALYAGLQQGGVQKKEVSPQALLGVISAWEEIRTEARARDLPKNEGPAAHEDLTISEQIALLATAERNGNGLLTFHDPRGEIRDLPEAHVESFLEEHGHEHSSDYREEHGHRWEDDFFTPCDGS